MGVLKSRDLKEAKENFYYYWNSKSEGLDVKEELFNLALIINNLAAKEDQEAKEIIVKIRLYLTF